MQTPLGADQALASRGGTVRVIGAGETLLFAASSNPGTTYRVDLLVAVGDAPAGEIIRSELNLDFVTRKNTDVVAPHLSGDVPPIRYDHSRVRPGTWRSGATR